MEKIQGSEVSGHIQAVKFDEMWHFFQKKKSKTLDYQSC
ncbi:hypothetical protein P618_200487 [Holospora obtusa F1]|uniref:Uncharacterized protein n=1 Tax=Holospora obtusa F1 TaxID=1399147 RepID=W6TEN6_HOLOB|nr:hypothetical protein P618_200487 [Holospora obtusa F1]